MSYLASFKIYLSSQAISADRVIDVFRQYSKDGKSASSAISILKGEGISYRRINMLEDFRRAGSLINVRPGNIRGEMKALDYFNRVIEPYRKQNNLSNKQAWKDVHAWEKAQYSTVEEAKKLEGANIKYGFGDTPTYDDGAKRLAEYAAKYGYTI